MADTVQIEKNIKYPQQAKCNKTRLENDPVFKANFYKQMAEYKLKS